MLRLHTAILPIRSALLSALLIGGMAMSCPGQTKSDGVPPKPGASDPQDKAPVSPLKLTLQASVVGGPGSDDHSMKVTTIKMTLTLQNPTQQPVILKFASGQKYDFILQKGKGAKAETLWQWSHGMMFTQMLQFLTVKPGDKLSFTQNYPPADVKVKQMTPGEYTIVGKITTMGNAPKLTAATTITVIQERP